MPEETKEVVKTIEIECKDCQIPFEFTAGEQEFYRENSLNPPKRCPVCRLKKKQRYAEEGR